MTSQTVWLLAAVRKRHLLAASSDAIQLCCFLSISQSVTIAVMQVDQMHVIEIKSQNEQNKYIRYRSFTARPVCILGRIDNQKVAIHRPGVSPQAKCENTETNWHLSNKAITMIINRSIKFSKFEWEFRKAKKSYRLPLVTCNFANEWGLLAKHPLFNSNEFIVFATE